MNKLGNLVCLHDHISSIKFFTYEATRNSYVYHGCFEAQVALARTAGPPQKVFFYGLWYTINLNKKTNSEVGLARTAGSPEAGWRARRPWFTHETTLVDNHVSPVK